jgi:hypothetical protein
MAYAKTFNVHQLKNELGGCTYKHMYNQHEIRGQTN